MLEAQVMSVRSLTASTAVAPHTGSSPPDEAMPWITDRRKRQKRQALHRTTQTAHASEDVVSGLPYAECLEPLPGSWRTGGDITVNLASARTEYVLK